jgi:hypothetical protein
MKREILLDTICALFILLFVYAGVNKLLDIETFRVQLGQSPLLTAFAGWIAWGIPTVEILIAIMLTIRPFRAPALYAAFSLMVMFTAYIIAILNFSTYIPCACGGVLSKLGWAEHLIFNIAFVLLGYAGIILQSTMKSNVAF